MTSARQSGAVRAAFMARHHQHAQRNRVPTSDGIAARNAAMKAGSKLHTPQPYEAGAWRTICLRRNEGTKQLALEDDYAEAPASRTVAHLLMDSSLTDRPVLPHPTSTP